MLVQKSVGRRAVPRAHPVVEIGRSQVQVLLGPPSFLGSELERAFRDMYTGTQRTFIGEKTYTDAAQIMLGLIPDSPGL